MSERPNSPLHQRMIEDMTMRNFIERTRNDHIRHVCSFTAFLTGFLEEANSMLRFQRLSDVAIAEFGN